MAGEYTLHGVSRVRPESEIPESSWELLRRAAASFRCSSLSCASCWARDFSRPPARMNSTVRRNSSLSNQVPWDLQTSTTTWEQWAKFTRFISWWQTGQGT